MLLTFLSEMHVGESNSEKKKTVKSEHNHSKNNSV